MKNNMEAVEVLTIIDEKNKIYYTEYQLFDKDSKEKQQAMLDIIHLKEEARRNGYKIIRRENDICFDSDDKEQSTDYSAKVMDDFLSNLNNIMGEENSEQLGKKRI